MQYREVSPPADLADLVEACWRVEGPVGDPLRILADACTDLIALESGVLYVGPMTVAEVLALPAPAIVGVRLRTGVRLALEGVDDLRSLRDREIVVELTPPPVDHAGLLAFLEGLRDSDRVERSAPVDRMLHLMTERPSPPTVAEACAQIGVSERTMQRLFDRVVGLTPRQCARVMRHIGIGRALQNGSDSIAELAAEHGYADQAHLSRDFRELAGTPPGRFEREVRRDGFVQDLAPAPRQSEALESE